MAAMKTIAPMLSGKSRYAANRFLLEPFQAWAALLLLAAVSLQAQTNLVISSFDFKAAVVWSNALPGHSYAVQRAANLETGAWSNVPDFSSVTPTGSTMTVLIPVSGPTGFYRVVDNGSCCTNSGGTNPPSALALGSVCGDLSGTPILISGCGGGWFRITIAECNASSINLQATITLTSPATANYDLYLYNTSFIQLASSTATSSNDFICVERQEAAGDRTFDVIIEVRPVYAFPCDNWTLDVRRTTGGSGCVEAP